MKWKEIVVSILSVLLAILGGSHYQQSNTLGEMQTTVKELEQVVKSLAHKDITHFESD